MPDEAPDSTESVEHSYSNLLQEVTVVFLIITKLLRKQPGFNHSEFCSDIEKVLTADFVLSDICRHMLQILLTS